MKEFFITAMGEVTVEATSAEDAWLKSPPSGDWDIEVDQIEEVDEGQWCIQCEMSCCVEADTDEDAWENSPDAGEWDLDGIEVVEE